MTKPFLIIFREPKPNPLEIGEYDDFVFYSCHKRYTFGPDSYKIDALSEEMDENDFRNMINTVKSGSVYHSEEQKAYFYPMFMLDHSGLSFSFTSFNDPWDSGLGAVVKISDENVEKLGNTFKTFTKYKELINKMNSFESEYDYGFLEKDLDTGELLNSVSGFDIPDLNVESVAATFKDHLEHEYTNYEYQYALAHIIDY